MTDDEILTRRDLFGIGVAIALTLALATAVAARVVAVDLREGTWWAIAGALRSINALAAITGVIGAVVAAAMLLERRPELGATARGLVAAAVTAAISIPVFLTTEGAVDGSELFVVAASVAAVFIGAALLLRRARIVLLLTASIVVSLVITAAAAYVDNSDTPVAPAVSLGVLGLPVFAAFAGRLRGGVGTSLRVAMVGLHAIGLFFVLSAATSCRDDDCVPVPLWFLGGALATLWATGALLMADRHTATPVARTSPRFGADLRWVFIPPVGFIVFAGATVLAIDPDRAPPVFATTDPGIVDSLPSMVAWDNSRGCVVVAGPGVQDRTACDAQFVTWVEPGPKIVVEDRRRRQQLFDPVTFERKPVSWTVIAETTDAPVSLRVENLARGRVEVWADEVGGASRRLLEAHGGHSYSLRDGGVSADGAWAAVPDIEGRLLLMSTDGTQPPTVMATGVRTFGGWVPEFAPPRFDVPLVPRDPLRVPAGVENDRDFYAAHRELDESLDLSVRAELVVVDDEVQIRFTDPPSESALSDGYCVSVTSFFESAAAVRTYRSVDVGGRVAFCDASTRELAADCPAPTVGTLATIDDLERFEVLVFEAQLIAPRSFEPLTSSPGYYQLSTGQVSLGALNPDDLPRFDDATASCR